MFGRFIILAVLAVPLCLGFTAARADDEETAKTQDPNAFGEIDTGQFFGFLQGSDVGSRGDKDMEAETNFEGQRRGSTYQAFSQSLSSEYAITDRFSLELALYGNSARIRNIAGFDDTNRTDFSGLSAAFKSVLVPRGKGSPFGLAVTVEPGWARMEDQSGTRIVGYSGEVRMISDTELMPNRLYLALNGAYEPNISKDKGATQWARNGRVDLASALVYRITPRLALGTNLEYLRQYNDTNLQKLLGQAIYLGPMLHFQMTPQTFTLLALETQVSGRAVGETRALDLTNFARFRAKIRFGLAF
ncbi:MAG: hypothetical protein KGQ46_00390 [Hyphomicrobiales bacterium]|nr:hypothetical protein [Hyphomicrobiales bacterium]MDE2115725.1 hypothetical protein [Hyphomicrobiales bacterium]